MFITVGALLILIAFGLYYAYLWFLRKQSAEMVDSLTVRENMRHSQVVDVRQPAEFKAKHILGARNIPSSEMKLRLNEIRKDQAVYLYDDNMAEVSRAARALKKNGHSQIYILKGGFSAWDGKIKSDL